jgi:hypothetical protein
MCPMLELLLITNRVRLVRLFFNVYKQTLTSKHDDYPENEFVLGGNSRLWEECVSF